MNLDFSILDRLESALHHLEEVCVSGRPEELGDALDGARQMASLVRNQWSAARIEVENLSRAQADAIVNAAMMMTELQETQEALESEIAEREKAQNRLRHDALHDTLTGLPNRSLLMDRLSQCVKRAERQPGYQFAVLFLDLDNFKVINDSLGHSTGDHLLIETTQRLLNGLRTLDTVVHCESDTTARLGGDEFVILLDAIGEPSDTLLVVERLQNQLAAPFQLDGQEVVISASVGIVQCQGPRRSVEELLRNADTAMYRAKHAGKSGYAVYDETMHAQVTARLELENALRFALDRGELGLVYQPIIELETGCITSFEALLRWHHPQRGPVSPAEFIPLAEETGLILPIGRWVMHAACAQLREWQQRELSTPTLGINVNVSKVQLLESCFVEEVNGVLRATGVRGSQLGLEVTESAIAEPTDSLNQTLSEVKALGVRLHMDDFGTGHSSLSFLHNLPLDILKIDRAFITPMESSRKYSAVVHAIITLARNLNMQVTAEGIETNEQLAQLITLDCQYAQGYYFSKPLSAPAAAALLASPAPWITRPLAHTSATRPSATPLTP